MGSNKSRSDELKSRRRKIDKNRAKQEEKRPRYYQSPYLEAMLCSWEIYLETIRIVESVKEQAKLGSYLSRDWEADGALINSGIFRKYLLTLHQNDFNLLELSKFKWPRPVSNAGVADFEKGTAIYTVPNHLANWTRSSRRIFRTSAELQSSLENLEFGNLTFEDLKRPFDCYGIEFSRPIQSGLGIDLEFVLVSFEMDGQLTLKFLGKEARQFLKCYSKDQSEARELAAKSEFLKLGNVLIAMQKKCELAHQGLIFIIPKDDSRMSIEDFFKAKDGSGILGEVKDPAVYSDNLDRELINSHSPIRKAINIALGLGHYFKTLPADDSVNQKWTGYNEGIPSKTPFVDESQVCTVRHRFTLDIVTRELLGLEGEEKRVARMKEQHWELVRSYFRRPNGMGKIPDAERSIFVNSYCRGLQAMPPVGLPS